MSLHLGMVNNDNNGDGNNNNNTNTNSTNSNSNNDNENNMSITDVPTTISDEAMRSMEQEVMAMMNVSETKAQATLKSQYGKPSTSNLAEGMYDMVKKAYGGTWLPFDDKGEDELKRISTLAAIKLTLSC